MKATQLFTKNLLRISCLAVTLSSFALLPASGSSAQEIYTEDISIVEETETDDTAAEDAETDDENFSEEDWDDFFLPEDIDTDDGKEKPDFFVLESSLLESSFNEDASFAEYEKNILQDDTYTLEILDAEDGCTISFKSSDTGILTVEQLTDTTCSYTGVGYGTAKIAVTFTKTTALIFKEKKTIYAKVSVTPRAVSVMFRQSSKKLTVDSSAKLAMTIRPSISEEVPTFASLNKKIATINKNGKVTAKKAGKTYVTATLSNGQTAKCKITVVEPDNTETSEE